MPKTPPDETALRSAAATTPGEPPAAGRSRGAATDASRGASPRAATGTSRGASLGALAGPLCLVLLAGVAMPPHQGLLLPLALALVMVVVGERRLRLVARAREALDRGAGSPLARATLLVAALGSVAVLLTVLARGVGTLLVEVPASLWGAGAALLAALAWAWVGSRLRGPSAGRAGPVVLLAFALAVPLAGVVGTGYEAAGPHARGWAHSGPILGIHPFQTTSILVDGQGPFDLPINDYVEPDGGRGYGPEGLADALDRALASIAERVYPQGPARIRRALLDAEVEAVTTPAVYERLDREPFETTQPRFVVRSGSHGRGSRIEFVCPGRRIDPRGPLGETVMNRMCPDKYASEASAGLGVTGRWSGYSEGRGQDRAGLHALVGWTRSDDAEGRRVLERETQAWAWIVLGLVAALGLRRGGPLGAASHGLRSVGGAVGGLAVVALVIAAASGLGELAVGAWPAGPSWQRWPSVAAWAPALALGSLGLFALEGPAPGEPAGRAAGRPIVAPAVVVVLATLAVATALPTLPWALPLRGADGLQLGPLVRGVAEAIGERGGLTIFEVEGAVASGLVGLLLGGAVATIAAARAALERLAPRPSIRGLTPAALVAVLAIAAALVVSRKTAGAAALVPGVIGMTLVLCSGLLRLGAREARGAAGHGVGLGGTLLGRLAPVGWTAVGIALVWAAVDPLPSHPFVTLCTIVGLLAVIAAGLASAAARGPRNPSAGARPPADPPLERRGAGRL